MKIKEVVETLERFAPLPLQESYDNAGLQIGLTGSEDVSGVLLCLDVTEEVIKEAVTEGCNMIVAHHPLLFRPLRRVTDATQTERCVTLAIREGIAVYAAHTNLDNAPGGVNTMMGRRLGLQEMSFLQPFEHGEGGSGIVGNLEEAMSVEDFLCRTAETFGVEAIRHNRPTRRTVRRVALCGGAGESLLDEAVKVGADAFLTGEMGYHRFFGREDDLLIAVLGHYQSEQYTVDLLEEILQKDYPGVEVSEDPLDDRPHQRDDE